MHYHISWENDFLVVLPGDVMYINEPTDSHRAIKLENIEVLYKKHTEKKNPQILRKSSILSLYHSATIMSGRMLFFDHKSWGILTNREKLPQKKNRP